jgi:hypothetical protein
MILLFLLSIYLLMVVLVRVFARMGIHVVPMYDDGGAMKPQKTWHEKRRTATHRADERSRPCNTV